VHPDIARQYLLLATDLAQTHSKDRSTRVGAYLVHPILLAERSRGYNGLPRGARDELDERHERPLKYEYFEHAETNAIFNKVRAQLKGSLCLSTQVPTMSDARAAISVGARTFYFPRPDWTALGAAGRTAFERVLTLLAECNVAAGRIADNVVLDGDARRARKLNALLAHERMRQRLLTNGPHAASAVFADPHDYTVLASGLGPLPQVPADARVEHEPVPHPAPWAEGPVRNAVYQLARESLQGSTAIVTLLPCAHCARALAASGIAEVFAPVPSSDEMSRWGDSFTLTRRMLAELGVPLIELERSGPSRPS
jgi:deoxycytidylate deaminase